MWAGGWESREGGGSFDRWSYGRTVVRSLVVRSYVFLNSLPSQFHHRPKRSFTLKLYRLVIRFQHPSRRYTILKSSTSRRLLPVLSDAGEIQTQNPTRSQNHTSGRAIRNASLNAIKKSFSYHVREKISRYCENRVSSYTDYRCHLFTRWVILTNFPQNICLITETNFTIYEKHCLKLN